MLRYRHIIRPTAKVIADAAQSALDAYHDGRAEWETMVTDRMLGAIEHAMKDYSIKGVRWRAKTLLPGRGQAAEERRHGADFLGVLDIELSDYVVRKGFIAQSKRSEPGEHFTGSEWERLREQAQTMLARTPASFVFVYSKTKGVRVVPAVSVTGANTRVLLDLYHDSVQRFFEDHLKSFIGDGRLDSPSVEVLDALAEFPVRRVLHLIARESA